MADQYLYDSALVQEGKMIPFISKEMIYVQDQQNSSYTNSITFDSSSLSNRGSHLALSESYLTIPYQITASLVAINATGYSAGLKNAIQVIDSMTVDFGNRSVVNLTSFLNVYSNFRMLSSWSQEDLQKFGDQLLFWPDSSAYVRSVVTLGGGACNNSVLQTPRITWTPATCSVDSYNDGFLRRLKTASYDSVNGLGGFTGLNNVLAANGKSHYIPTANLWTWNYLLVIRLKDICDFFAKLPILQGTQLRLTINFNAARTTSVNVANTSLTLVAPTMIAGRTNPMMLSPTGANNPNSGVPNGTINLECNVLKTSLGASAGFQSGCRWYIPSYILAPEALATLRADEVVEVNYLDLYFYPVSALPASSSFTYLISNGILAPDHIVVVPFLASSDAVSAGVLPYQSIFDSCPDNTSPLVSISQFNVQIQGSNLYSANIQYDHDMFMNELSETGINGGCSTGLSSGLISQSMWTNNYRYYLANLSRRVNQNEVVSIGIQGITSANILDLMCFVAYNRTVKINKLTGNLVD